MPIGADDIGHLLAIRPQASLVGVVQARKAHQHRRRPRRGGFGFGDCVLGVHPVRVSWPVGSLVSPLGDPDRGGGHCARRPRQLCTLGVRLIWVRGPRGAPIWALGSHECCVGRDARDARGSIRESARRGCGGRVPRRHRAHGAVVS